MRIITLTTDKELQVYMHPKRQQILHMLEREGSMTAKQIASESGMTPSSAKHHVLKLMDLLLVEVDRQEMIHGITATYYKKCSVTVSFGALEEQKRRLVTNLMHKQVYDELYSKERSFYDVEGHFNADMLSGVVHLEKEQADELYSLIRRFLAENDEKKEGTEAYVYSLVAFRA